MWELLYSVSELRRYQASNSPRVDLIKDQDGNSYIVEVNGNRGSKIIDIAGHNYFMDLVEHIEGKVGVANKK